MNNILKVTLKFIYLLASGISPTGSAQNDYKTPYHELPEYPTEFTAGTMAARMVDALGLRFYWATNNLNEKDLSYEANSGSRSVEETIKHIYDLSKIIMNSTLQQSNNLEEKEVLSYSDMRDHTLNNLNTASKLLRERQDISQFKISFGNQKFSFWNQVNGPIADAIWHCGQIATSRRTTGNPINSKVNHFTGELGN
jgi:hypothetical protein